MLAACSAMPPKVPDSRVSRGAVVRFGTSLGIALVGFDALVAQAGCQLTPLGELPVTMIAMKPTVHAKINGTDAVFIVENSSVNNMLTPAAVAQYKLRVETGVVGSTRDSEVPPRFVAVSTVKTLTILKIGVPFVDFFIIDLKLPDRVAGVLGQSILGTADVEYDLANGVIRLIRPKDCSNSPLAYWSAATSKPYAVIDIKPATPLDAHMEGLAYVNGKEMKTLFETTAAYSFLTLEAAKRADITPGSVGVVPAGSGSTAGGHVTNWLAPIGSFKIGDEEVRNTKMHVSDVALVHRADLVLGADFLLAHRVYVANSQRKLYLTYNGGRVFNLTAAQPPGSDTSAAPIAAEQAAAADDAVRAGNEIPATLAPDSPSTLDNPSDAAGYARRGSASSARRDYERAMADYTRACELAPGEPEYPYQRGLVRLKLNQADLALADFDQAIKLKPNYVPALVARARLHTGSHDAPQSVAADLDAADHALPDNDFARLQLASIYERVGDFPAAVRQYSKWIESHNFTDAHMGAALNSRCWARALWGQELNEALADCDRTIRERSGVAAYYDSRGLVHLRRGEFDRSIADYDMSLKLRPQTAWSLYGRGIAKLRTGRTAEARADIAAAQALQPSIAGEAATYGIKP
jgi:tetratricopeptide (TPR) repeat protein